MNGKNIANIRKKRGIRQEELAQLLSINTSTLSRWENGHFEPNVSFVQKLCQILHCTESELLNGSSEGKIRVTLSYDIDKMKEGVIDMDGNGFDLFLGKNGRIGLQGAATITSKEAIEEVLAKIREQLEIGLEAQIRRGIIQEA